MPCHAMPCRSTGQSHNTLASGGSPSTQSISPFAPRNTAVPASPRRCASRRSQTTPTSQRGDVGRAAGGGRPPGIPRAASVRPSVRWAQKNRPSAGTGTDGKATSPATASWPCCWELDSRSGPFGPGVEWRPLQTATPLCPSVFGAGPGSSGTAAHGASATAATNPLPAGGQSASVSKRVRGQRFGGGSARCGRSRTRRARASGRRETHAVHGTARAGRGRDARRLAWIECVR